LELHLVRAYRIASYCQENPEDDDVEEFVDSVINSLRYFMDTGYAARNWWYNEIAFPKSFAFTAAMLARAGRTVFMEEYAAFAIEKTNLDKKGINGANLADFCNVQIAWSLAVWITTKNPIYLTFALNASQVLSKTCAIVARPEEGFLDDFSIAAHNGSGVQLSSCAYGPELVGRAVENAAILVGAFAITREALCVVEAFLLRGAAYTFFHGMTDLHPCGRGMSRRTLSGSTWVKAIDVCLDSGAGDPMLLRELKARIAEGESANHSFRGSRGYWTTDYLAHFGEKIGGWAKTCSTRTVGSESGNGENLRGYYMGWGSTLVASSREDYWDIQPVWNWQRVPGTTVEQDPAFSFPLIDWGNGSQGSHAFCGVVSNEETGINTMLATRRNISSARKTVFAHRDMFYFVGSAIDISGAAHPVVTTVDQMKPGTDAVTVKRGDGTTEVLVAPCDIRDASILTVTVGDRKRYDFPGVHTGDTIVVSLRVQAGSWKDINSGYPDTPIEALVLTVGIEHMAGREANYVYMIASKDSPINWLAGPVGLSSHWVTFGAGHIAVVASGASSSFTLGRGITIKPLQRCAFIAKAEDGGVDFTCADLTQTLAAMAFDVSFSGTVQRVDIVLPVGEERGKSVTVRIEHALAVLPSK
jgi:chondroitin AC lyase